jgi:ABC-type sulfate transport system permease component
MLRALSRLGIRAADIFAGILVAAAVSTMPVMSKEMHQGACGEQQKGKNSEQVCAMLGDKKESRDQQKADKYKFHY